MQNVLMRKINVCIILCLWLLYYYLYNFLRYSTSVLAYVVILKHSITKPQTLTIMQYFSYFGSVPLFLNIVLIICKIAIVIVEFWVYSLHLTVKCQLSTCNQNCWMFIVEPRKEIIKKIFRSIFLINVQNKNSKI